MESSRQDDRWGTPIAPQSDPSAIAAFAHGDEWTVNRYQPSSKKYHFQDKAPRPLAKTDKPERIRIEQPSVTLAAAKEANVLPASFSVSASSTTEDSGRHRISDSLHISEAAALSPNVIQVQHQSLSEDLVNQTSGADTLQPTSSTMPYGSSVNAEIVVAQDVPGSRVSTEDANLQEASKLDLQ